MKFGVREICDVVFKAKSNGQKVGNKEFAAGQPVLYIDSAKTSTVEGAATTVYATGGKGNTRLLTWEGEKTLTFTVEDALLSPIGFAVLSGAGLFEATASHKVYVHATSVIEADNNSIDLSKVLETSEKICATAPVFVAKLAHGSLGDMISNLSVSTDGKKLEGTVAAGTTVFVDYYIEKTSGATELIIDAENFGGYYYVEASTLVKRESDGKDLPTELVFPKVKIQSSFTFTMASSGDPSTFTFTMDAMPDYTRFDRSKKVLFAMQIVNEDSTNETTATDSVKNDASSEKTYPLQDA